MSSEVIIEGESYVRAIKRCTGPWDRPGTTTHLYKGTFSDIEGPMCRFGYSLYGCISIFRGNHGKKSCKICLNNAHKKRGVAKYHGEE